MLTLTFSWNIHEQREVSFSHKDLVCRPVRSRLGAFCEFQFMVESHATDSVHRHKGNSSTRTSL